MKICKSDIKEEQNVLFIKKKKKKAQRFNVKCKILEGKVNLTFYSAQKKKKRKKKRGAQLFFNEIIMTWSHLNLDR